MRVIAALLAFLFGLAISHCAEAAITLVHTDSATAGASATASITTGTFNLATGSLIVVFAENSTSSTDSQTVTDTAGNTFTPIQTASADSTHLIQVFYAKNTTANANDAVTCHFSPSASFLSCLELVYTGADTTAPLDTNFTGNSSTAGTTATSGTFTTTKPNEVLVAGAVWESGSNVFSAGTGYTKEVTDTNAIGSAEDKIVSSIQTSVTATMTNTASAAWMIVGATFKDASQPSSSHSLTSTGAGK